MTILATTAGVIGVVQASPNNNSAFPKFARGMMRGGAELAKESRHNLTEAQIADLKIKMDAVKSAETAGDYSAWVTAVKALDANSPLLKKITSADSFKTYLAKQQAQQAKMTTQTTKLEAVQTALDAGNYDNWAIATKALNDKSPLLTKITATNFSQYVQANNLNKQAEAIYKTLGLEQGGRPEGFGPGKMMNGQRGPGGNDK